MGSNAFFKAWFFLFEIQRYVHDLIIHSCKVSLIPLSNFNKRLTIFYKEIMRTHNVTSKISMKLLFTRNVKKGLMVSWFRGLFFSFWKNTVWKKRKGQKGVIPSKIFLFLVYVNEEAFFNVFLKISWFIPKMRSFFCPKH